MSTIIAGHFQLQDETDSARAALLEAGYPAAGVSTFFVNPAGQHDVPPLGHDKENSIGAKEVEPGLAQGMTVGAMAGAAIGAATIPVTGPLGPVVGALVGGHVGSLYSFSHLKEAGEPEKDSAGNLFVQRESGMMVAVALPPGDDGSRALSVLRRLGAHHIERAEGIIENGDWRDFSPASVPLLVDAPA